jgi:hypothetical protein
LTPAAIAEKVVSAAGSAISDNIQALELQAMVPIAGAATQTGESTSVPARAEPLSGGIQIFGQGGQFLRVAGPD